MCQGIQGWIQMSKAEKLKRKFKQAKSQFTWPELVTLLTHLGFRQIEGEGSRVAFTNDTLIIKLHRPHPQKEVKAYAVRLVREVLENEGLL
jgi:predicted RNA binding protein YcfA (HicA-like mRNA interferase family)